MTKKKIIKPKAVKPVIQTLSDIELRELRDALAISLEAHRAIVEALKLTDYSYDTCQHRAYQFLNDKISTVDQEIGRRNYETSKGTDTSKAMFDRLLKAKCY